MNEQLGQVIQEMQAAGMSDGQIRLFMGKLDAAKQADAQASSRPSQSDRVEIRQSEGNVPGVYVDATQVAQDLYAEALARGAQIAPPAAQGMIGAPPRAAGYVDMAMGNPNYKVSDEGSNVTVNESGHIIRY